MKTYFFLYTTSRPEKGVALVVVLAMLTILSVLLISFSSMMKSDLIGTVNYSYTVQTETLSQTALDCIISELQAEIAAGSNPTTVGSQTVYSLKEVDNKPLRKMISPARFVSERENTSFPNLLRKSTRSSRFDDWSPNHFLEYDGNFPERMLASDVSTESSSKQGRFIRKERWGNTQLLYDKDDSRESLDDFTAPDWVLITRNGPKTFTSFDSNLNKVDEETNPNAVIGRFAYVMYETGGLLNLNAAGHPPNMPSSRTSKKGSLAFADLGVTGLNNDQIATLVGWRNQYTASPSGLFPNFNFTNASFNSFENFVFNGATNFLTAASNPLNGLNDQAFFGRQDLLNFAQTQNWPTESLQYFTSFSRSTNSPSHRPSSTSTINPNLSTVFINGKPITRFPLNSRLALLSSGNNITDIQKFFGLTKSDDWVSPGYRDWIYNPDGIPSASILSIQQVLDLGREPNFFELLKAGILNDSLGAAFKATYLSVGGAGNDTYGPDVNPDHHLIRIGLNIIDQYDNDNYPTTATFDDLEFYGIEDLPYFSELFIQAHTPNGQGTHGDRVVNYTGTLQFDTYVYFELWNPHQPPPSSNPSVIGPQRLRIRADAGRYSANVGLFHLSPNRGWASGDEIRNWSNLGRIEVPLTNNQYRSPSITTDGPLNRHNIGGNSFNGYRLTSPSVNFTTMGSPWTSGTTLTSCALKFFDTVFVLEYDSGSGWKPYTTLGGYADGSGLTGLQDRSNPFQGSNKHPFPRPKGSIVKSDPRTFRYGASMASIGNSSYKKPLNKPMVSSSGYTAAQLGQTARINGSASDYAGAQNPGMLYINTSSSLVRAPDPDGVFRPGDGHRGSNPMEDPASQPLILNRPFRSIGELGYVFRDIPWKTLDLNSETSADSALLDLFCLNDSSVTAEHINLNTRHPEVLTSLLSECTKQEYQANNPNNLITTNEANQIARDIVNFTNYSSDETKNPFLNLSEIITRFSNYNSATNSNTLYSEIKNEREAIIRALGSTASTRTWNLMIDVITQSGNYPESAQNLSDFYVRGEKRYWVHLAIDRYTGQVVDQLVEPVYE